MPKRSAQEKILHYQRKLRKLEEKENLRLLEALNTQSCEKENMAAMPVYEDTNTEALTTDDSGRNCPLDDTTDQEAPSAGQVVSDHTLTSGDDGVPSPPVHYDHSLAAATPDVSPPPAVETEMVDSNSEIPCQEKSLLPDLDPELLKALGDPTDDLPKFGPNIHPNLAERWQPLLRKGLSKDSKEKLLKEYLIPENCPLLQAPKLNPEIAAATTDMTRNRDKKLEAAQQQLGVGISAINKGLTMLLTSQDKVTVIKHISDGCRILADLHYLETQVRIKMVTPVLAKPFLNIVQDSERDETLFGNNLPDKIKASKAIEKQGLQIRKPAPNPKSVSVAASSSSTAPRANQYTGNWQGSSRYPSNRGGRGGPRKPTISGTSRRQAPLPQSRPAGQSKPRVVPQQ